MTSDPFQNPPESSLASQTDTLPPSVEQEFTQGIQNPPTTWNGVIRKLGPGLIVAASIVGSGELIATTKTGAQAGLALLWLILIGCFVKVFVQVELGRYSITHGRTTLDALNTLPGKIGGVNFILWFFLVMLTASTVQMGGIVGGVGQSMAISFPLTGDYRNAIQIPSAGELAWFQKWEDDLSGSREQFLNLSSSEQRRVHRGHFRLKQQIDESGPSGLAALELVRNGKEFKDPWTLDDRIWAGIVTAITIAFLYSGSYGVLQALSTLFVVAFTITTVGNVFALQWTQDWSLSTSEFLDGLKFRLPDTDNKWVAVQTALATFGIIGVGAAELIVYPYWCIEKGYARFTGKRSADPDWARRARGWLRVMRWDAFFSMVVYTLATVAFYIMGAAVLHREGRDPEGLRMVSTLASAYVPIFGHYAKWLFLMGAVAVLYSTFLVANAGHARMLIDFLKVYGAIDRQSQTVHDNWLRALAVILPLTAFCLFAIGTDPVFAVLASGFTQSMMLPLVGLGTLYFRWKETDERLKPTPLWDVCLVISFVAFALTGAWGLYTLITKLLA